MRAPFIRPKGITMNDQNPSTPVDESSSKRSLRNPFAKNGDASTDETSKLKTYKSKAKTVLAVVGAVTVASVVVGAVAKKKNVSGVEVSLPDVDVTSNDV